MDDKPKTAEAGGPSDLPDPSTIINGGQFNFAGRDIHHHYPGPAPESKSQSMLKRIPNFRKIHIATLGRATPDTGYWVFIWETFQIWIGPDGYIQIIWGSGMPGAGKTILTSIIINELEAHARASAFSICICYVYFRYSDNRNMTVRCVLEVLVKQTIERHPECLSRADQLYASHAREDTEPTEAELLGLLRHFTGIMAATFYFLDALDEAPPGIQLEVVKQLSSLNVRLFITSRPLQALATQFPQAHHFHIVAQDSDLDLHIAAEVSRTPELYDILSEADPAWVGTIPFSIKKKCGGMFLHASLQLNALRECTSIRDVKETLEEFPAPIEDVYLKTWNRILSQPAKKVLLAKKILLWVLHAQRSLTVEQLRQAVATSPDTYQLEPERLVPEETLVGLCRGLVMVEGESRLVRLAHYTAKDPLLRLVGQDHPHPHSLLAAVCITRLANCGFQRTTLVSQRELQDLLDAQPLLAYAHYAWSYHAHEALREGPLTSLIADFVTGCHAFPVLRYHVPWPWFALLGPLHVAAFYNLPLTLAGPRSILDPNVKTAIWEDTPLHMACLQNSQSAVEELLCLPKISVNAVSIAGRTPLMYASRYGHEGPAGLLLAHPGIRVNVAHRRGSTALIRASRFGHKGTVKLLLSHSEIDVNLAAGHSRESPLISASRHGNKGIVKLFLAAPKVDVNQKGSEGATALMVAAQHGCEDVIKLLLADPRTDVNSVDDAGWSTLSLAARDGREGMVKLLLAHPSINVNVLSELGSTALIQASKEGKANTVKLLLAHPQININLVDREYGRTALRWASRLEHKEIVNLLLSHRRSMRA